MAHAEGSERRFRSNIALEGLGAWEEHSWVGHKVRIGTVTFDVVRPKVRCLATHANPTTGARDVPMLTTLTQVFGQEKPTFGVAPKRLVELDWLASLMKSSRTASYEYWSRPPVTSDSVGTMSCWFSA